MAQPLLSDKFHDALSWASRYHACQERKLTKTPYVSHLMSVAAIVLENGGDEETAIAALFHDLIEDQSDLWGSDYLRGFLRNTYGERVLSIVNELTETDIKPKPPWKQRKLMYLNHLRVATAEACLIAAADKLHNARTTLNDLHHQGPGCWERFNADPKSQKWWYTSVFNALVENGSVPAPLLQELDRVIQELFREQFLDDIPDNDED